MRLLHRIRRGREVHGLGVAGHVGPSLAVAGECKRLVPTLGPRVRAVTLASGDEVGRAGAVQLMVDSVAVAGESAKVGGVQQRGSSRVQLRNEGEAGAASEGGGVS